MRRNLRAGFMGFTVNSLAVNWPDWALSCRDLTLSSADGITDYKPPGSRKQRYFVVFSATQTVVATCCR